MVLYGPLHVARGRADGWFAEGGVAHAEHAELSGQAIQVQADAVKVGIGGASSQGRSHCILRCGILRHGSWVGFSSMASMLGKSRKVLIKAENSVAAPAPTAPANSSCSADGSGLEFSMRDTNSQERGEGKALRASRSKALSNSGRKRMNAMASGRISVLMAHSHHSCTPPRSRCERTGSAKAWASAS